MSGSFLVPIWLAMAFDIIGLTLKHDYMVVYLPGNGDVRLGPITR